MSRFSRSFERDWKFYVANCEKFQFSGTTVPVIAEKAGKSAKECFHALDSRGELLPCCEPELFVSVVQCKRSVNLHIKMWVDGYLDALTGVPEYLKEFIDPPAWVEVAFRRLLYGRGSKFSHA